MRKKGWIMLLLCTLAMLLSGCGNSLKDGYYTAEMSEYSFGWKEYLCIQVKNGQIISAEFNAKNDTGFIKAWDNTYMDSMFSVQETYPNKYTREYVAQLIKTQNAGEIDILSGATTSGDNFLKLVEAVLEQAKIGDFNVKVVE